VRAQQALKAAPAYMPGQEVPLVPSAEMSIQLAGKMPPVDDPNYTPTSPAQFGLAIQTLVVDASTYELNVLYRAFKDVLTTTLMKKTISEAPRNRRPPGVPLDIDFEDLGEPEPGEETPEEYLARQKEEINISDIINWDDIGTDLDPINKIRNINKKEKEEEEDHPGYLPQMMSFKDMAEELGFSGPAGARGAIERISRRMQAIKKLLKPAQLNKLHIYATAQFIKYISDYIDPSDREEFMLNRDAVRDLDTYRFFFVNTFIMPTYNKVRREARKGIEAKLIEVGIPKKSILTITNILFGEAQTSPEQLKAKLKKDLGENSTIDPNELLERFKHVYPELKSIANLSTINFLNMSKEKWETLATNRKKKAIITALEQTNEFQNEQGAETEEQE